MSVNIIHTQLSLSTRRGMTIASLKKKMMLVGLLTFSGILPVISGENKISFFLFRINININCWHKLCEIKLYSKGWKDMTAWCTRIFLIKVSDTWSDFFSELLSIHETVSFIQSTITQDKFIVLMENLTWFQCIICHDHWMQHATNKRISERCY